jgi:hypothetical protein
MHPHRHGHTIRTQHLYQSNSKAVEIQRSGDRDQQDVGNEDHNKISGNWRVRTNEEWEWRNTMKKSLRTSIFTKSRK